MSDPAPLTSADLIEAVARYRPRLLVHPDDEARTRQALDDTMPAPMRPEVIVSDLIEAGQTIHLPSKAELKAYLRKVLVPQPAALE